MTDHISIREFARREGVSHTLVVRAVKTGRLTQLDDGLLDAALVGTKWRMGPRGDRPPSKPSAKVLHRPESSPAPGASMKELEYGEALRVKENYLAFLRRLDYEQRSGSVVDMGEARSVVFELCREQRDVWLAWPARVAPLLAAELNISDLDGLLAALTLYVQRQLAELGEPDADANRWGADRR
jgi:hypothetical protein